MFFGSGLHSLAKSVNKPYFFFEPRPVPGCRYGECGGRFSPRFHNFLRLCSAQTNDLHRAFSLGTSTSQFRRGDLERSPRLAAPAAAGENLWPQKMSKRSSVTVKYCHCPQQTYLVVATDRKRERRSATDTDYARGAPALHALASCCARCVRWFWSPSLFPLR